MAPLQACVKEAGDCRTRDDFENHTKAVAEAVGVYTRKVLAWSTSLAMTTRFFFVVVVLRAGEEALLCFLRGRSDSEARFIFPVRRRSRRLRVVGDDVPAGGAAQGHGRAHDRRVGLLGQQGPDAVPQDQPRTGEGEGGTYVLRLFFDERFAKDFSAQEDATR